MQAIWQAARCCLSAAPPRKGFNPHRLDFGKKGKRSKIDSYITAYALSRKKRRSASRPAR